VAAGFCLPRPRRGGARWSLQNHVPYNGENVPVSHVGSSLILQVAPRPRNFSSLFLGGKAVKNLFAIRPAILSAKLHTPKKNGRRKRASRSLQLTHSPGLERVLQPELDLPVSIDTPNGRRDVSEV